MLAEEIAKRKAEMGGAVEEPQGSQTQIDMNIDAYLPSYIYDSMQKIEIYKKVGDALRTLEEAEDLLEELVDRFGDPPQAVVNLLSVARLKVYGQCTASSTSGERGEDIALEFRGTREAAVRQ